MTIDDIKWLHVEASSKCNAWCPACPRNVHGYGVTPGLVEQDLLTNKFEEVISRLPNLETVQFCGNYGDPIIAKNILELISIAKQYNKKIQIHTNGSLRSTHWWHELAEQLHGVAHDVWFGLDGLKGVHEIYRQATDFNKVIENANAFIGNGGYATWQFIPFAHNEHQTKDCIRLSQQLGFKKFKIVKHYRNANQAQDYKTGQKYTLSPASTITQTIHQYKLNTKVDADDCMHLEQPSIYLDASGTVSRCCYQSTLASDLTKKFDTIDELLYNNVNLTDTTCIISCGK